PYRAKPPIAGSGGRRRGLGERGLAEVAAEERGARAALDRDGHVVAGAHARGPVEDDDVVGVRPPAELRLRAPARPLDEDDLAAAHARLVPRLRDRVLERDDLVQAPLLH